MSRLSRKPKEVLQELQEGRYDRFNLTENPFPTVPVNKDSNDRRINGDIYEREIRDLEYTQIEDAFLKRPQSDLNRLRIGYICDTSYIGRGNGKSAFLVNLMGTVNRQFCLDISQDINKCFALYVSPEPGGRTKTFGLFVEQIFDSIVQSNILEICLASMRLDALAVVYPDIEKETRSMDEDTLIAELNSDRWFARKMIDPLKVSRKIGENDFLQSLPPEFPLFRDRTPLFEHFVTKDAFVHYFKSDLKKPKERLDFIFSHLVLFFMAAGFNGAYILVDDFERIPDFQSERQKRDFALELRSCILDGPYLNTRYGFYNILLVLHAGVPRLIEKAWNESGLENRYPISIKSSADHWVAFEKLTPRHVLMLVGKYLSEYRLPHTQQNGVAPFTEEAISVIAETNEYNAARVLRTCWDLLDQAADDPERKTIDAAFVRSKAEAPEFDETEGSHPFDKSTTTDLREKATET